MGELRSVRIAVSLTQREHDALRESANRQRVPVAKAAARIIRGHLANEDDEGPASHGTVVSEPLPAVRGLCAPAWLPPIDKSAYADWARMRAGAVEALLDRYPGELTALSDGWASDAAVREQLWALSVWRDHLDVGVHDDPRMELAFAASLSDFEIYLRERHRPGVRQRG